MPYRTKPAEVFEPCTVCLVEARDDTPGAVLEAHVYNMRCFALCEAKRATAAEWIKRAP